MKRPRSFRCGPRSIPRRYLAESRAMICLVATGYLLLLNGASAVAGYTVPARDIRKDHFSVQGWSSDGIVFIRYGHRQRSPDLYEVAVASLDGHERKVISSADGDCPLEATVSPNGTEIAYPGVGDIDAEYDQAICDIFLVRSDGAAERNLTNTPGSLGRENNEVAPKWSPDGTAIGLRKKCLWRLSRGLESRPRSAATRQRVDSSRCPRSKPLLVA
jgi:Tol biopolymer transport system component